MDVMPDEKREAIPAIGYYPHDPISTGLKRSFAVLSFPLELRTKSHLSPTTLVVCRSGTAADTQAIADIVKYHLEVYTMLENEPVTIYRATQIFRKFLYNYRDQLSASVLVAGWDEKCGGQLYALPIGGFVTGQKSTASGSGSTFVQGYLDNA
ncbi:peptidase, T1 family [Cooperia oncophora]